VITSPPDVDVVAVEDRTAVVLPAPTSGAPQADENHTFLRAALLVCGLAFLVAYVGIALFRWRYPYELEWMEGGVLGHVHRVLDGQPLYGAPSLRFTPFIYTPLYYYASAGAAWLLGPNLSTLRLVSILGSVLALWAIYRLVTDETKSRWAGLIGACLFAACFRLAGAWLDLARVDALFMGLLLAALVCVRGVASRRRALVAGLLFGAAILTKQEALLPSLAVLPFLWRRGPRLAATYGAALAAAVAVPTLWLQNASHGWFLQYMVVLPTQHAIEKGSVLGFWAHDLVQPLAIAVLFAVAVLASMRGEARRFYVPVVAALILASYSARLHTGGYDNVLLPAYAGVAITFGIGCHAFARGYPRIRAVSGRVVLTVAIVQFAVLAYNPFAQVPATSDVRAGDRLVADLQQLPRPVYLPGHSWLLGKLHEPTTAHAGALGDILRGSIQGSNRDLRSELQQAVAARRFGAIVVDSPSTYSYLPRSLRRYYCIQGVIPRRDVPHVRTGTKVAPATVWVPRTGADAAVATGNACPSAVE
jgi:hypothetical protein